MEKKRARNSYDSIVGKTRSADSPIGFKKSKVNPLGKRFQTVSEEKNAVIPETVNAKNSSHSTTRRHLMGNYESSISDTFYAQFPYFNESKIDKQSKFQQQKREDYNAFINENLIGNNKVRLKSSIFVDQEPERKKINIVRANIYSPRYGYLKDLEETQKRLKHREETQQEYKEFLERRLISVENKVHTFQEKQKTESKTNFREILNSPRYRDLKYYDHTDLISGRLEDRDKSSTDEKLKKMKYRAELEKQIEEKRIAHIKQKENFEGDIQREILRTVDFAKEIYGTCSSCSTLIPVEWFSLHGDKLNTCPKCVNKCAFCIPHCDGDSSKHTDIRKIFQAEDYDLSLIHEENLIASPMHRTSESKVVVKRTNGEIYYKFDETVQKPLKINNLDSIKENLEENGKLPEDMQRSSFVKKNKMNTHTKKAFHDLDNRPIFSACAKKNN